MKILAAPIIHARTKNVDFRTRFLVRPEDFTDAVSENVRSYVLNSTAYFELAGPQGRRLVLCDEAHVITGVSMDISRLSSACGRKSDYCQEGKGRSNFAFIGLVFPKKEIRQAFDVPLQVLLDLYEKYMKLRWEEPDAPASYEPTKASYELFELPEARRVSDLEVAKLPPKKCVIELDAEQTEAIAARVILEMGKNPEFCRAFCSDMPNAASVIKGRFDLVTSQNAESIRQQLLKKALEERTKASAEAVRPKPWRHPVAAVKKAWRKEKTRESAEKIIRFGKWAVAIIGTVAVVLMSRDSEKDPGEWR